MAWKELCGSGHIVWFLKCILLASELVSNLSRNWSVQITQGWCDMAHQYSCLGFWNFHYQICLSFPKLPYVFVLRLISVLLDSLCCISPCKVEFRQIKFYSDRIHLFKFQKMEGFLKNCRNTEVKTVLSEGQKVILRLTEFIQFQCLKLNRKKYYFESNKQN